jgi:glycosyltransferase involved in cell wall biosynthesis
MVHSAAQPLVSIVMAFHNGAPYLRDAVTSVLAQSHGNLELLLCDDASTDDAPTIAQAICAQDPRAFDCCGATGNPAPVRLGTSGWMRRAVIGSPSSTPTIWSTPTASPVCSTSPAGHRATWLPTTWCPSALKAGRPCLRPLR